MAGEVSQTHQRMEGRMIPGGEGQEGVLRGSQEAKAWDPAGSGEEGARTGWRGRPALTAYRRMRFSLSSLGYSMLLLGGEGGHRSALKPVLAAFPHQLPGTHHSWQNRIPTKPGS